MDLALLSEFFMYMTGINILLYVVIMVLIRNYGKKFIGFHIRFLKLKDTSKDELELLSLRVMGRYKVLILIFNLVPLLALHLMSS